MTGTCTSCGGYRRDPRGVTGLCGECRRREQATRTAARNARIVAEAKAGVPRTAIAARYRLSRGAVNAILRAAGIFAWPNPAAGDPLFRSRAEAAVARMIAARVEDLYSRSRAKPLVHARWAVWSAMHARGYPIGRIAARYGVDRSSVRHGLASAPVVAGHFPVLAAMLETAAAA